MKKAAIAWCFGLMLIAGMALPGHPAIASAQDPSEFAAVDIIYVGAGKFSDAAEKPASRDGLETSIYSGLQAEAGQSQLRATVEGYFQQVAATRPDLRLRVVSGAQRKILGENLDQAALATIAFDHATMIESGFQPGAGERQLFVSLPLFLVSAKSYHLIHCRPLFVRIRLEPGVSSADPEIVRRVLAQVGSTLGKVPPDSREMTLAAAALRRGAFRDPNQFVYAMAEEGVTFSANATNLATGFRSPGTVTPVLRDALCAFLAETERVFPPVTAKISSQLYRDLGAEYYGLEVITDLSLPRGFPRTDSGRLILPIRRIEEDLNLKVLVKTGVRTLEEGRHFRSGQSQVLLEVSGCLRSGSVAREKNLANTCNFTAHVNEAKQADGESLMEAMLAAAAQLKTGFK